MTSLIKRHINYVIVILIKRDLVQQVCDGLTSYFMLEKVFALNWYSEIECAEGCEELCVGFRFAIWYLRPTCSLNPRKHQVSTLFEFY